MTEEEIKLVLHESISPYFVSIYSTLISVVQGLAIGGLFFIIGEAYPDLTSISFWVGCRIFIIFLLICFVWHRYVSHFQYLVWKLDIFDAIIPMGIAVLQTFAIVSIKESIFLFSFCLSTIFFMGIIAYSNVVIKHDTEQNLFLFKNHFSSLNNNFATDLFDEIDNFNRQFRLQMFVTSLIYASITVMIYVFTSINENTWTAIVTIFSIVIFIFLYINDMPNKLRESEKLKAYSYFRLAQPIRLNDFLKAISIKRKKI